jgi:hypothetical protein
LVAPLFVIQYLDLYVERYGQESLELNFYGLFMFYQDDLGKKLLHFFYEETIKPSKNNEIYRKIHKIYHSTCHNHPFKKYLFFQSFCLTETKRFHIGMYICQFFSYYGMFCCSDFLHQRIESLTKSFRTKSKMLIFEMNNLSNRVIQKILFDTFQNINKKRLFYVVWINQKHLANERENFSNFLHKNWNDIDRNIFLWDLKGIRFQDSQKQVGQNLTYLYTHKQIQNFINPNLKT